MADYSFGGNDEENAELKKLNAEVLEDPDSFENWEKLVRAAESLDGGLNRNSSPQSIVAARDIYDRFLFKFPLLFGYWKKYADLEFSIAGTEAAELVYERGVASITNSVDLWTNYCSFKVETSHDPDVIRELFERGAGCVGLDFLAHPFWDKYLEFEERLEAQDRIFAILDRVVHIPMHQYARYFERYRHLATQRPLHELMPADMLAQFRSEVEQEGPASVQAGSQQIKAERGELEIEREVRTRIDNFHLEIFSRTQTETTKRWTYESEIKRPYFHVTELDEGQLVNWRKYLDFEEVEGDYTRASFLYERCLVTCAYYDEFWLRYARWMLAQPGKEEEVRNIYQRASMLYAPISRPAVRLQYAYFEEMCDAVEKAKQIHEAILEKLPGHIETIISLANLSRRHGGLEAAIGVYKTYIDSTQCDIYAKAALVAEWARLLWKSKGSTDEARQVFQKNQHWYLHSRAFWINYLNFELEQPTSAETESLQYKRIKQVHDDIRRKSHLPPLTMKDLSHYYMVYLLERGTKEAAKEYMTVDREVNGPFSVQSILKAKLAEDGKEATTQRRMMMENGHPGVAVDEAAIRKGENPYTKYFHQQGEQQLASDAQLFASSIEDMAPTQSSRAKPHCKRQTRSSPNEDTKPIFKRGSIAPYICALCKQGFTRKTTVKEPHFASCVKTNGNPNGVAWDDHPSCYSKRPDGTMGPSGTVPAGLNSAFEVNEESDEESALEHDEGEVTALKEKRTMVVERVESVEFEDADGSSIGRFSGSSPFNVSPGSSTCVRDQGTHNQNLQLDSSRPVCQPTHAITFCTPPATKPMLSGMVMNQLVNIVIAASRTKAGLSDKEASKMFKIWRSLLPEGTTSNIVAPHPHLDLKGRQQAVVWLAQDVYGAYVEKVQTVDDQLKMVRLWRDLIVFLNDEPGHAKIQGLLVEVWDEDGPKLLGEVENNNWKRLCIVPPNLILPTTHDDEGINDQRSAEKAERTSVLSYTVLVTMTTSRQQLLHNAIWSGSIPLEIRLSPSECRVYDQAEPYFIHYPRLSYLPFLLPRLHAFFASSLINPDAPPNEGWFSFENVPLKWHYPLGLLYDLFSGAAPSQAPESSQREHVSSDDEESSLPWRLTLHFTEWPDEQLVRLDADGKVIHDAFINSVKEADFLRNGTAKGIMSLSKDDSTQLWTAVQDHNSAAFNPISQKLLYAQGAPLRHIPLKIYLPSSPSASEPTSGHLRVVQSLITPAAAGTRESQTLGAALHTLLPALFPSRRTPILAKPVLHGSVVPMGALVEELLRGAAYLDGWIHLGLVMMG